MARPRNDEQPKSDQAQCPRRRARPGPVRPGACCAGATRWQADGNIAAAQARALAQLHAAGIHPDLPRPRHGHRAKVALINRPGGRGDDAGQHHDAADACPNDADKWPASSATNARSPRTSRKTPENDWAPGLHAVIAMRCGRIRGLARTIRGCFRPEPTARKRSPKAVPASSGGGAAGLPPARGR